MGFYVLVAVGAIAGIQAVDYEVHGCLHWIFWL